MKGRCRALDIVSQRMTPISAIINVAASVPTCYNCAVRDSNHLAPFRGPIQYEIYLTLRDIIYEVKDRVYNNPRNGRYLGNN